MIADMPRKLPMNVVREKTRHGKIVFYFRKGKGERIRMPGMPGSAEFDEAYKAAMGGHPVKPSKSDAPSKSLRWLIDRYRESAKWAGLSVATRKQQGLFFQKVVAVSGNADFRAVTSKDIRNALEERKKTPALANNFLKAMKGLFGWALINEHVEIDPTAGVERLKNKSDGFPPWTVDDVARFCEKWPIGTKARLAMELILLSGLRRSDVHRAGRQHMNGKVFSIRTHKTGTVVTVEFSDHLMSVIEQTKTGDLHFLTNEYGKPYTVETFGNWFRDRCRDAGIVKSAHGLRKLSATMAANAGATTHELMAQYGWATTQQAEVYTKGADRVRLGVKASRMVAEQIEATKSPHPITGKGRSSKKIMKSTSK